MEISEKTKQAIGISIASVGVIGMSYFGYLYYKKVKKQAKIDELIAEGETEYRETRRGRELSDLLVGDIYNNNRDRSIFKKLKDIVVNKIYPQDYDKIYKKPSSRQRDRVEDLLTEDRERFIRNRERKRFTVYSK